MDLKKELEELNKELVMMRHIATVHLVAGIFFVMATIACLVTTIVFSAMRVGDTPLLQMIGPTSLCAVLSGYALTRFASSKSEYKEFSANVESYLKELESLGYIRLKKDKDTTK